MHCPSSMMPADHQTAREERDHRDPLRIAILIPILNEAQTLSRTLRSITAQDYPHELIEILIVDGGSSDDWREAVAAVPLDGISLRTIANPRRVTPAAVNLALKATDAPAVLWISGHCTLAADYLRKCAEPFVTQKNIATGGRLVTEGSGLAGRLNAFVLRSPIGTGLAPWRFRQPNSWVSAVNFALFDRQSLLALGGLDERLIRNQDNDLIRRLRQAGTRFWMVDSEVTYLAPATLLGLWRRAWGNASWNIWCWRLGVPATKWYHLAPMAAVLLGVVLLLFAGASAAAANILIVLAVAYLALILAHTLIVTLPQVAVWAIPILPFHLVIFHALYGIGGWTALVRKVPGAAASRGTSDR